MTLRVSTLFFDMNSFYASVAQAEEPALMGRPVGVLTTDAPGAACIAASYDAKQRGVRMGTRQEEARQLCPGIVFRPVKHDVCVRYHHAILAAVETVLPVHRVFSIDECSCLLTGSQQELTRALQIGRDLQRAVLERVSPALSCSVGLAPTRLLAKIAAGLRKPGGLRWLLPHVLPEAIAHLGLDGLPGISGRMRARLEAAGVADVPTLYHLDPKRARAIWGNVAGERFVRELRGETVVWPETQRSMIGHGQVLTAGNKTPEGARLVARRLLVKAAARLRREEFHTTSLHVGVKCAVAGHIGHGGEIRATQDTFFLLDVLARYWRALPPHRALAVSVTLGGLVPDAEVVPDLFAPVQDRRALCAVVDRLNQRFGQDTVRYGLLPPHHVPYTGTKIAFGRIPTPEDFLE